MLSRAPSELEPETSRTYVYTLHSKSPQVVSPSPVCLQVLCAAIEHTIPTRNVKINAGGLGKALECVVLGGVRGGEGRLAADQDFFLSGVFVLGAPSM